MVNNIIYVYCLLLLILALCMLLRIFFCLKKKTTTFNFFFWGGGTCDLNGHVNKIYALPPPHLNYQGGRGTKLRSDLLNITYKYSL